MSRLSALPSNLRRRGSKSSITTDTTYHSFQDIDMELREPESPPRDTLAGRTSTDTDTTNPTSTEMRRQDSGYESLPPRTSHSSSRRRTASTVSSTSKPIKTRPSVRRSAKSPSQAHAHAHAHAPGRTSGQSLYLSRSHPQPASQPPVAFFHFPSPDPAMHVDEVDHLDLDPVIHAPQTPQLPPQTTHYWTSDQTRRLEYAAIDAASRGVKGWVMRHLVPDCFVPKEKRIVGFDDDRGSVRRYRLDLDDGLEESATSSGFEKMTVDGGPRATWPWGRKGGPAAAPSGIY